MIDSHCHIDAYADPMDAAVAADQAGVLTVAVTNTPAAFERAYPHVRRLRHIRLALGLHPLTRQTSADLHRFEQLLDKTIYVGEVGLDFSPHGTSTRERQQRVFRRIAELIAQAPHFMTVHSRGAEEPVLDILDQTKAGPAVFHWYTGSQRTLERLLAGGHYCSINPAMTASTRGRAIIRGIPKERMLTETDGPFTRVKGTPTTPRDVSLVVKYLATFWNVTEDAVVTQLHAKFTRGRSSRVRLQSDSALKSYALRDRRLPTCVK